MLASQAIGEALHPLIAASNPRMAGKLTGAAPHVGTHANIRTNTKSPIPSTTVLG